jgi:AcrR family transcriptional regulator
MSRRGRAVKPAPRAPRLPVGLDDLGPRGRRTRAALVVAARDVFEERRYANTHVEDIVARAGVSHGTFYTYFTSREMVFREVSLALQAEMLERASATRHLDPPATLYEGIERANRGYLESYRDNARMLDVLEEVAGFNETIRGIRREIRADFIDRAAAAIGQWQDAGLAFADVDGRYAAMALGAMVERFAYVWFVLGEPIDFDEAVRTLSLLWLRALGVAADATAPTSR